MDYVPKDVLVYNIFFPNEIFAIFIKEHVILPPVEHTGFRRVQEIPEKKRILASSCLSVYKSFRLYLYPQGKTRFSPDRFQRNLVCAYSFRKCVLRF